MICTYSFWIFADGKPQPDESMEVDSVIPAAAAAVNTKAVFNSEGRMVFSKFDFSNNGNPDTPIASNKALAKMTNVKGLKGYKKQLEFVEEKQKKLEQLKVRHTETFFWNLSEKSLLFVFGKSKKKEIRKMCARNAEQVTGDKADRNRKMGRTLHIVLVLKFRAIPAYHSKAK